jgi:hypothetical protein
MLASIVSAYAELGLTPIPIEWHTEAKAPRYHLKEWDKATPGNLPPCQPTHNGLAVRTYGEWGCIDFDLKNTDKKDTFDRWMQHIGATMPDLLGKLFIEQTRSGGYHVWLRYGQLPHKTQWAQSVEGAEVIAMYANGPLVYTYPTPGYTEVHQGMQDVEALSDAEFAQLAEVSQFFNEYKPGYDPSKKAVNYPQGLEKFLTDFDNRISNEAWATILADIGLVELAGFRYRPQDKFKAYRRTASASPNISAKVYFHTKRLMLFTASMPDYPNWHTKESYPVWSLPPSFVLFYKHNREWPKAVEAIKVLAASEGIETPPPTPGAFPLYVFPTAIAASISEVAAQRSLPPHFVAAACLWGASSLAGNCYQNKLLPDVANILYMFFIAPVSVGKSPAIKAAVIDPIKKVLANDSAEFKQREAEWKAEKESAAAKKKSFVKPRPIRYLPIIQDGTTESFLAIHLDQPSGIGVFYDEAETLFNAGNYKAINDSTTFLTTIFNGGPYVQTRANRELERVIPDINVNIIMGTQPERMRQIFTQDKIDSGFAARFLMVTSDYMRLNEDADPMSKGAHLCRDWVDIMSGLYNFGKLYNAGEATRQIEMTDEAVAIYRAYYRKQLQDANMRIDDKAHKAIIGLGAKMSAYTMRLTNVLAIIHNVGRPLIDATIMQHGIDLFTFFYTTAERIIMEASAEAESGLPAELGLLYEALPDQFTRAEAEAVAVKINQPPRRFEVAIRRKDFKALFRKVSQGVYAKN